MTRQAEHYRCRLHFLSRAHQILSSFFPNLTYFCLLNCTWEDSATYQMTQASGIQVTGESKGGKIEPSVLICLPPAYFGSWSKGADALCWLISSLCQTAGIKESEIISLLFLYLLPEENSSMTSLDSWAQTWVLSPKLLLENDLVVTILSTLLTMLAASFSTRKQNIRTFGWTHIMVSQKSSLQTFTDKQKKWNMRHFWRCLKEPLMHPWLI